MGTTASSRVLLSDEVWSQIPRTSADRRVVSAALLALLLVVPAMILGSSTGILVPRLSYEGGSTTAADTGAHTLTIRAIVRNHSSRSWRISGATVDAPGTARELQTTAVDIPAHRTRTVVAVVNIDNCAATLAAPADPNNTSYPVDLRVDRLLGTSTLQINAVDADMIGMACGR